MGLVQQFRRHDQQLGARNGRRVGVSTITATVGNISGLATLTVQPALVSITVAPINSSIKVGTTLQFTVTGHYSDGSSQSVTNGVVWSSSKTGVATVSGSGLATAVAKGSTTIKAKLGAATDNTTLTVIP